MDARRDMQPSLTFAQVCCQGRVSFVLQARCASCYAITVRDVSPGSLMYHGDTGSRWKDEHGSPTLREVSSFQNVISLPLIHSCFQTLQQDRATVWTVTLFFSDMAGRLQPGLGELPR